MFITFHKVSARNSDLRGEVSKLTHMKTIEVVAGVIIRPDQKIFCVQRGESSKPYISKKWEFPGGKLEAGEGREEALIRELEEELKVVVENLEFLTTVDHTYPDFRLIMHAYTCAVAGNEHPVLTEHLDYKWLGRNELEGLDWAAADVPIVDKLKF